MSKERILTCMGPPLNKAAEGQTEVWSYASGNARTTVTAYSNDVAVGTRRSCTVNIVMSRDRVSAVNYSGRWWVTNWHLQIRHCLHCAKSLFRPRDVAQMRRFPAHGLWKRFQAASRCLMPTAYRSLTSIRGRQRTPPT